MTQSFSERTFVTDGVLNANSFEHAYGQTERIHSQNAAVAVLLQQNELETL